MNRRTFIQSSVATAALTSLPSQTFSATPHKIDKVGLQLYTVREAMKTDVPGTVAKVAATGYKEVEFAGYYNLSAKEIGELLKTNGLTAPVFTHISRHHRQEMAGNPRVWPRNRPFLPGVLLHRREASYRR